VAATPSPAPSSGSGGENATPAAGDSSDSIKRVASSILILGAWIVNFGKSSLGFHL